MNLPPSYAMNLKGKELCKLEKVLYGLKQSPRAWFFNFSKVMISLDTSKVKTTMHIFIKYSSLGELLPFGVRRRYNSDWKRPQREGSIEEVLKNVFDIKRV